MYFLVLSIRFFSTLALITCLWFAKQTFDNARASMRANTAIGLTFTFSFASVWLAISLTNFMKTYAMLTVSLFASAALFVVSRHKTVTEKKGEKNHQD